MSLPTPIEPMRTKPAFARKSGDEFNLSRDDDSFAYPQSPEKKAIMEEANVTPEEKKESKLSEQGARVEEKKVDVKEEAQEKVKDGKEEKEEKKEKQLEDRKEDKEEKKAEAKRDEMQPCYVVEYTGEQLRQADSKEIGQIFLPVLILADSKKEIKSDNTATRGWFQALREGVQGVSGKVKNKEDPDTDADTEKQVKRDLFAGFRNKMLVVNGKRLFPLRPDETCQSQDASIWSNYQGEMQQSLQDRHAWFRTYMNRYLHQGRLLGLMGGGASPVFAGYCADNPDIPHYTFCAAEIVAIQTNSNNNDVRVHLVYPISKDLPHPSAFFELTLVLCEPPKNSDRKADIQSVENVKLAIYDKEFFAVCKHPAVAFLPANAEETRTQYLSPFTHPRQLITENIEPYAGEIKEILAKGNQERVLSLAYIIPLERPAAQNIMQRALDLFSEDKHPLIHRIFREKQAAIGSNSFFHPRDTLQRTFIALAAESAKSDQAFQLLLNDFLFILRNADSSQEIGIAVMQHMDFSLRLTFLKAMQNRFYTIGELGNEDKSRLKKQIEELQAKIKEDALFQKNIDAQILVGDLAAVRKWVNDKKGLIFTSKKLSGEQLARIVKLAIESSDRELFDTVFSQCSLWSSKPSFQLDSNFWQKIQLFLPSIPEGNEEQKGMKEKLIAKQLMSSGRVQKRTVAEHSPKGAAQVHDQAQARLSFSAPSKGHVRRRMRVIPPFDITALKQLFNEAITLLQDTVQKIRSGQSDNPLASPEEIRPPLSPSGRDWIDQAPKASQVFNVDSVTLCGNDAYEVPLRLLESVPRPLASAAIAAGQLPQSQLIVNPGKNSYALQNVPERDIDAATLATLALIAKNFERQGVKEGNRTLNISGVAKALKGRVKDMAELFGINKFIDEPLVQKSKLRRTNAMRSGEMRQRIVASGV